MTEKLLPTARFGGWSTIRDDSSDSHINQIWRTSLNSPGRGIQGFLITSYRVEELSSDTAASTKISDFISRHRFSDYIAKGYEVLSKPWTTTDGFGAVFNINGVTHGDTDIYNRAVIYAFGLTRGNSAVTLEIRLSVSGENLNDIKKGIEKNDITVLSTELVNFIIPLWQLQPIQNPQTDIRTDLKNDPPPAPDPPQIVEASPDIVIIDLSTDDPSEKTGPDIPPAPDVTENRWFTIDHHLSIVIPPTWKYTGNDKLSTWVSTTNTSLRIYTAEKYDTNADLAAILDDFAISQQAISFKKFTRSPFAVDGAVGVLVRYSDYLKNTTQSYLFGKSGRIWRIDISIPGENAPFTDEIKNMILSVKAD